MCGTHSHLDLMMMSSIDSKCDNDDTNDACYVNHKLPSLIASVFFSYFDRCNSLRTSSWFRWFTIFIGTGEVWVKLIEYFCRFFDKHRVCKSLNPMNYKHAWILMAVVGIYFSIFKMKYSVIVTSVQLHQWVLAVVLKSSHFLSANLHPQ